MKVSTLIELLREHDPDAEVIMSSDAEGKSFHPVDELSYDDADDVDWGIEVKSDQVVVIWPED